MWALNASMDTVIEADRPNRNSKYHEQRLQFPPARRPNPPCRALLPSQRSDAPQYFSADVGEQNEKGDREAAMHIRPQRDEWRNQPKTLAVTRASGLNQPERDARQRE